MPHRYTQDEKMKETRQALARGYCTKRNEKKILDSDLIEDMAIEVELSIKKVIEGKKKIASDGTKDGLYGEALRTSRRDTGTRNQAISDIAKLFGD